jgi:hypothetical protein
MSRSACEDAEALPGEPVHDLAEVGRNRLGITKIPDNFGSALDENVRTASVLRAGHHRHSLMDRREVEPAGDRDPKPLLLAVSLASDRTDRRSWLVGFSPPAQPQQDGARFRISCALASELRSIFQHSLIRCDMHVTLGSLLPFFLGVNRNLFQHSLIRCDVHVTLGSLLPCFFRSKPEFNLTRMDGLKQGPPRRQKSRWTVPTVSQSHSVKSSTSL